MPTRTRAAQADTTPTPDTPGATPTDPAQADPVDPTDLTPETWGAIIATLGLDATATPDDVLAAIGDLVTSEAADAGKPSAIAAAAGKIGLQVIDEATVTELRAAADEGRRIKAAAAQQHREHVVDTAVRRGAITPARRQHWLTLLQHDPEMEQVLASTPDETAYPIRELGHSGDVDDTTPPGTAGWVR